MKNSELTSHFDFTIPRKQSYAAIVMIAYRMYKVLLRQLFPFLIVFFVTGGEGKKDYLLYVIIATGLLGMVYSIIAFFKYFFFIKDDKLIVHKGVFKKSKLEIPFDRIQSINFEQNVLHRIFNVVKLNMDTAGSAGSELQLNALDHGLATALSEHILRHRQENELITNAEDGEQIVVENRDKKSIIFSLSIAKLLKVGITANHLRSGGLIIFFFFWIWDNVREAGLDLEEKMKDMVPTEELLSASLILVVTLAVLFIVVAFLISLIRTVLRYYDLKMFRKGEGFVIESGLLNRREMAAKDEKIQLMTWSQNLLQTWGNIFEMNLKQASSVAVNSNKSISVVGLDENDVELAGTYLFNEDWEKLSAAKLYPVNSYYRYKKLFYRTLIFVPVITGAYLLESYNVFWIAVVLYVIYLVGAQLSYVKKKYGFSDSMLMLMGGTWGRSATKLLLHKIQNISLMQTPFQRRRGLGSLVLHTVIRLGWEGLIVSILNRFCMADTRLYLQFESDICVSFSNI